MYRNATIIAAAFIFPCIVSAQAPSITRYGDPTTWQYLSSSISDVTFEGLGGTGGAIDKSYSGGLQVNGVAFRSIGTDYLIVRSSNPSFMYGPGDSDLGCPPPRAGCGVPGGGIAVTLPPGATSVALNLATFWPAGPLDVRFSNGQTFTIGNSALLTGGSNVFAGFTSTVPLNSFVLQSAGMPIVLSLSVGSYVPATMPFISSGGIVPAYAASARIQPGEWISIYGVALATTSQTWSGDFPTSLGGTTVTINGKPAYLSFVSPNQINAQAPDDIVRGGVQVTVTNSLGKATSSVQLADLSPAFNLIDSIHVAGIILRSDHSGAYGGGAYDIVGPGGTSLGFYTVPAKVGDVISLFGGGFGPTLQAQTSGKPVSTPSPTINPVRIIIGDSPAVAITPSFSGLSSAGLYQINLTIPAGMGRGDLALTGIVNNVQTQSGLVISVQ